MSAWHKHSQCEQSEQWSANDTEYRERCLQKPTPELRCENVKTIHKIELNNSFWKFRPTIYLEMQCQCKRIHKHKL